MPHYARSDLGLHCLATSPGLQGFEPAICQTTQAKKESESSVNSHIAPKPSYSIASENPIWLFHLLVLRHWVNYLSIVKCYKVTNF